MLGWLVWTVLLAGALLLLSSGADHVVHRRQLGETLLTHRLPDRLRRWISHGLGLAEIIVGAACVTGFLSGGATIPVGALVLFYSCFAVYLSRLIRVAPGVRCGCFGGDEAAGVSTVVRAVVFVVAGCVALAMADPGATLPQRAVVLAAAAVGALMSTGLTGVTSSRRRTSSL